MVIGDRLKELREAKNLSQGDIEKRTGLLRSYTSRVENGHTIPSVETLEKYASALEIPLYKLFYDDTEPLQKPIKAATKANPEKGSRGKDDRVLRRIAKSVSRMDDQDRQLLIHMAAKFAARNVK
jgi:transcriptional regulator with XRE-family HTH domain